MSATPTDKPSPDPLPAPPRDKAPMVSGELPGDATPSRNTLDLAVVGNCSSAALIDMQARFVFCCLPRFDSDPMFCDLLTGGKFSHGFWEIELLDYVRSEQEYIRNTAVLSTKLYGKSGCCVEVIDFAPKFVLFDRSFHPTEFIRIVKLVSGRPRIRIKCRPSFNYGEKASVPVRGSNHISYPGKDFSARLTTDAPISFVLEEVPFVLLEDIHLIFGPNESLSQAPSTIAHDFLQKTLKYWYQWVQYLNVPFEYQAEVIRAAITLKLCSYEESGAILAALTTSIPEAPNSGRNWDYRFCWLRDSFHTVRALNSLGATKTMEDYLRFIINIVSAAEDTSDSKESEAPFDLQPLYGILMQTEVPESICGWLPGYRSMGPVRRGNEAYIQLQNDNYGSVILSVAQMFFDERLANPGKEELFKQLERVGLLAVKCYDKPDAGLWELRGSMRVHTFSVVMCWAACDRLAKIAVKVGAKEDRVEFWKNWADKIKAYIMEKGWSEEEQSFLAVCSGETKDVDAALLLLAELGFVSPKDPKFAGTVAKIERELKKGDFLFRYVEEDDFGRPETAFTICTFWYVNALARMGRKEEAKEAFGKLLKRRNHVGLFSEDLDIPTGELWGNFPQTYSMVGLINSAIWLSIPWTSAGIC